MQQPSFQKWDFARAKHQGPWRLRFLCAPCWWLGLRIGVFSRKFCEGLGESQSALQALQKNSLINNNLSWEGDCVMLAACLQGYDEIIWSFGVIRQVLNESSYKRSCCSTLVPRKISMQFAKDSRTIFFIREEWTDEGILINHHIYIHINKQKSINI